MPNPENIKPHNFKPGQSGNLSGRPRGIKNKKTIIREILSMSAILPEKQIEALQKLYPSVKNNMSIAEIMTIVQAHKAITKADTFAFKAIMDYADEAFDENTTSKDIKITVEYVTSKNQNEK
ncbi:MAG: hypothetical protein EOM44_12985 [Bacteroidia bacterium]|nr:hypothetical protein [Bacteroidia bacterium]